ncbi:hypothetical protein Agub_g6226 [Astrephomene gubernaculifera]|uniref:Uncharacterized protein n=1 Tax=Astrephomene gubernaculifera TaxID=47775 RepID=A0AAD3DQ37_9CHLO|nr:hypothetical protein Agub_g6226 [Astrephomene gubernaculifera]
MNTSGIQGGDGQSSTPAPAGPPLAQLKEALRVLDQSQQLLHHMKSRVVYVCGEAHLLASEEGRQMLAGVIKGLDEDHRIIRAGWPRMAAAMEVARLVGRVAAARSAAATAAAAAATGSSGGGGARINTHSAAAPASASPSSGSAAAAAAAAAASSLQGHCRAVVQQLDAALCEEMLGAAGAGAGAAAGGAGAGAAVEQQRRVKRARTDEWASPTTTPAAASPTSTATRLPMQPASSSLYTPTPTSASPSGGPLELLGVLLRLRALDAGLGAPGCSSGSSSLLNANAHGTLSNSSGSVVGGSALGGMRLHALDDGGNPISLPSGLLAAISAAAQAVPRARTSGGGGAAIAAAAGGGVPATPGGAGGIAGGVGRGRLPLVDGELLSKGAARLAAATQVRMLLPGVLVANVVLEGPGSAAPLRVAVDCADRAFEIDPWATPTTQVFRRLSALATRVLTYYLKRGPLSAATTAATAATTAATAATTATATTTPAAAPHAAAPLAAGSPPQPQLPALGHAAGSPPTPAPAPTPPPAPAPASQPHPQLPAPLPALQPLPAEPLSPGAAALEDLLLWLVGCRDLFSKRCAATGRLLACDPSAQFPVPPIFRPFKLPRQELRLRALEPGRSPAYHMHVAPLGELGWEEDVAGQAMMGQEPA